MVYSLTHSITRATRNNIQCLACSFRLIRKSEISNFDLKILEIGIKSVISELLFLINRKEQYINVSTPLYLLRMLKNALFLLFSFLINLHFRKILFLYVYCFIS